MKWIEAWISPKDRITQYAENLEDVAYYVDHDMTIIKKIGIETGATKYARLYFTERKRYKRSTWFNSMDDLVDLNWRHMHFTFKSSRQVRLHHLSFEIPLFY